MEVKFDAPKTYANRETMLRSMVWVLGLETVNNYRYVVLTADDGRVYPVFLMHDGMNFMYFVNKGFCVAG